MTYFHVFHLVEFLGGNRMFQTNHQRGVCVLTGSYDGKLQNMQVDEGVESDDLHRANMSLFLKCSVVCSSFME